MRADLLSEGEGIFMLPMRKAGSRCSRVAVKCFRRLCGDRSGNMDVGQELLQFIDSPPGHTRRRQDQPSELVEPLQTEQTGIRNAVPGKVQRFDVSQS